MTRASSPGRRAFAREIVTEMGDIEQQLRTEGGEGAQANARSTYSRFLEALNRRDLGGAEACVNAERYRENCVGFTKGFVNWSEAKESLETIWKALPDLHVELHNLAGEEDYAVARGTVSGTATGRLYGAPATKRRYEASFFDYVRVEDGRIVERVQQADVLGQMRQLYGRAMGLVGLGAMFLRQ
jgi:predicted ester cyclase